MIRKSSIILLLFLMGCNLVHTVEDEETPTGVQNVPIIVKALEAIGNAGKKEVDKEEKK